MPPCAGGEQLLAHRLGCTVFKHKGGTLFIGDYLHLYHAAMEVASGTRVAIVACTIKKIWAYAEMMRRD